MKKLLLFLFSVSVSAESNPYDKINKRNAFDLTENQPVLLLPPVEKIIPSTVFLTGITKWNGIRKAHLVLRRPGETDKFISLKENEKQYNVELKKILSKSAIVLTRGEQQIVSFEKNRLPTVVVKKPSPKSSSAPSRSSRDRKDDKKDSKNERAPTPAGANVVKVPSRNRGITDPRMQSMMERGLEYLNKIHDPEKKEAMLERLEKFQRGDYDKDRIKRYEEYKKNRDRNK